MDNPEMVEKPSRKFFACVTRMSRNGRSSHGIGKVFVRAPAST